MVCFEHYTYKEHLVDTIRAHSRACLLQNPLGCLPISFNACLAMVMCACLKLKPGVYTISHRLELT